MENKTYTVEEKKFMMDYHPEFKLESLRVATKTESVDEGPFPDICFFTEEGWNAFSEEEFCETLYLTLRFRDLSGTSGCRFVGFEGCGQLLDSDVEKPYDFEFIYPPTMLIPVEPNNDGVCALTLPMICRKYDNETDEMLIDQIFRKNDPEDWKPLVSLGKVHFMNQFVEESFYLDGTLDISDRAQTLPGTALDKHAAFYDLVDLVTDETPAAKQDKDKPADEEKN